MKGIKLKTVEERKYEVIKKLVSTCGNKKRASLALMVTVRTVDRLVNILINKKFSCHRELK